MAILNRITFHGYFIHKNGTKTYKLLSVIDNNYDETFHNLLDLQEENTIISVLGIDMFIKTFKDSSSLVKFWKENNVKLKGKNCRTYIKCNELSMKVIEMIDIHEKSKVKENVRKKENI